LILRESPMTFYLLHESNAFQVSKRECTGTAAWKPAVLDAFFGVSQNKTGGTRVAGPIASIVVESV